MAAFSKKHFQFIIEGKSVCLPRALVSRVSKPLDTLMNGGFAEAANGKANLEDVDYDTFSRFKQWLQTRKCTPVAPIIRVQWFDSDPDAVSATKWIPGCGEAIVNVTFHTDPTSQRMYEEVAYRDDTNVLLADIRLYVFADKWHIGDLGSYAWKSLAANVEASVLWGESIPRVVSLIQFAYDNTVSSMRDGAEQEPLRRVVLQYVKRQLEKLLSDSSFRDYMENREFRDGVAAMMLERLDDLRWRETMVHERLHELSWKEASKSTESNTGEDEMWRDTDEDDMESDTDERW